MTLKIGFSPCPNDTFIFDALVNNKIDTGDITFEPILEDVQTLNNLALEARLDISKISYGVLPLVLDNYVVLQSGGALGKGVGPLLIARHPIPDLHQRINNLSVAIPGENTTAHMLFSLAFPLADKKNFLVFNEIENAVLSGVVDAGVIIHENRFTYRERGLSKLLDLGEYWEGETGLPIPLGGIIIKRTIDNDIAMRVNNLIKKSLQYAFNTYPELSDFVKMHAQEMSEDVMRKHINLYVNNYSIELGEKGRSAVNKILDIAKYKIREAIFAG